MEWRAEIEEVFRSSGLVPGVLDSVPPGLVNVNFGTHNCVHMGTALEAETAAYEPSAVSYPVPDGDGDQDNKLYTLLMFDADRSNAVHWLEVNVPGVDVDSGETVAEYNSPVPARGDAPHRYVVVAMGQAGGRLDPAGPALSGLLSPACDYGGGRDTVNVAPADFLRGIRARLGLDPPAAANFFTVAHDEFVDSIVEYCKGVSGGHAS